VTEYIERYLEEYGGVAVKTVSSLIVCAFPGSGPAQSVSSKILQEFHSQKAIKTGETPAVDGAVLA